MLEPHSKVVVGVSGGADSVCLLFALLEYAKQMPLELAVVHINHGIRPEAGEDAAYVKELCEANGLPFYLEEADVRALAEQWHMSEEEAGRNVRYRAFERVAGEIGADRIAVAHNSNDNAETILFHLFRGSGIRGLTGIRPVRDRIIRPILCLERAEIEAFLTENQISYCQDVTNSGDDYTRNRIRHHILPYAEQEVVAGSVAHISGAARLLQETEDYLEKQTDEALNRCGVVNTGVGAQRAGLQQDDCGQITEICFDVQAFLQEDIVIQKRLLNRTLTELSPNKKDISSVHVQDLLELFTREGNRGIDLPFGIKGRRQYGQVLVLAGKSLQQAGALQDGKGQSRESTEVCIEITRKELDCLRTAESEELVRCAADGTGHMVLQVFPYKKGMKVPENQYTKWFDYDKIDKSLYIRTRQTGDYLTIKGANGELRHKSLKDYMVTEKIPADDRNRLLFLAIDEHVLWLPGYRISEYFKISGNTKYILQVQLVKMEEKDGKASC